MTTNAQTPTKVYFEDVQVGDQVPKLVKSTVTHLDDVITCKGAITEKFEVEGEARISGKVQAADQNGDVKVTGTFVAALPRRG